jgi:hypothetical protein
VTAGSLLDDGAMDMLQRGFLIGDCADLEQLAATARPQFTHALQPFRNPRVFGVRGAQSSIASRARDGKPAKHVVFSGSEGPNLR